MRWPYGGPEPAGLGLTPENVTGEVLSLLFATAGQVDEGVVVFGDSRPDIAATSATLYEFDLANPDPISAQIELKPGFVGGNSEHMVILFGHLDVNVNLDGQDKVVRVATASVGGMQRGDKLLQNASGDFEWYDLDTASFTSTRPANPAVTDEIASFTDPIRPNLVFYPFNVFLVSPVPLDPGALAVALNVDVEVNFMMSDAVTLVGQSSESIDDATFITSFSMTQSVEGFGDSGFLADATMTVNP